MTDRANSPRRLTGSLAAFPFAADVWAQPPGNPSAGGLGGILALLFLLGVLSVLGFLVLAAIGAVISWFKPKAK